jgi:hypothetical protein
MKTILILLCVLTLASCESRNGDRAKTSKTTIENFDALPASVVNTANIVPPQLISNNMIEGFVYSNKGRYINPTLVIIKHSEFADSLIYWTYLSDNNTWHFLDLQ